MGNSESTLPSMGDSRSAAGENRNFENHNRQNAITRNQHRETDTQISASDLSGDDPWWWEIENANLVLDRVPNITTNSDLNESSVRTTPLSDDFNTLLKIGENVNLTVNSAQSDNMENSSDATATSTAAVDLIEVDEKLNNETASDKTDYPISDVKSADKTRKYSREERESSATQSLEEFKEELRLKRMARQTAVQDLRDEIMTLRKQLASEQELTHRLRRQRERVDDVADEKVPLAVASECLQKTDEAFTSENTEADGATAIVDDDDENVLSRSRHANIELANAQLALQLATSENLSLRTELGAVQKQVGTLKEVVACCKQMLSMKEEQCNQLKTKLSQIEESFGEREMKIMSDNLRQEYERQLGNIRQLRQLYEERQRIAAAEQENLQRLISIKKDELAAEQERTKSFEERNQTLLKEVETANNELAALREECNEHKFEKKTLKEEMGAVNTLFSQMVMGFNGKNNLDIDRLATMLEENRTLLNDMATKEINCSDGATLPKLLFELVEQAAVGANRGGSRCPTPTPTPNGKDDEETVDDNVVGTTNNVLCTENDLKNTEDTVEACNDDANEVHSTETIQDVAVVDEFGVKDNSIVAPSAVDNETANININTAGNNSKKQHQQKSSDSNNGKAKILTSSCTSAILESSSSLSSPSQSTSTFKLHEPEVIGKVASTQEIIGNLPKVWKVLMELLSHHKIEQVQFEENGASEDCYKSVETPNGPKAELSVSKTYIKLKDLILEKKSLVKETNRLKTLNCHLDYRLNEQEKRLSAVSLELTKTWHLVGKMQRQHRQLHTQEQILRYQLQQKRRLLSELKDELEYCRRKWAAARAKNDESQEQCNDLRREFAKRKLEDANNSAESGYSDSGPPSDEEERAGAAVMRTESSARANGGGCHKRDLRKTFEHSRKIKRMQSTSAGRAVDGEIELRWNSAPPTCGWRVADDDDDDSGGAAAEGVNVEDDSPTTSAMQGAVPKHSPRSSRSKQRLAANDDLPGDADANGVENSEAQLQTTNGDRAERIQRLEEQCKSLIQQVLETSDNRERLEVQLCRFQDEISPVQYAIPLDEFISKKRLERMTRASSAPATPGILTPREEEYTRKRSERLGRLEEESRQLISRIKRTSDRGHYLRCSLDRVHRGRAALSREGSFESNTEDDLAGEVNTTATTTEDELRNSDAPKETSEDECTCSVDDKHKVSPLTDAEQAYTARRAERLKRLEAESKQLLNRLSHNTQRGDSMGDKLDSLHEKYGSGQEFVGTNDENAALAQSMPDVSPTIENRIENIERISSNRDERLRILEEEGKKLISRLSSTSARGTRMINRIAEREQSRLARQTETPTKELEEPPVKPSELSVLCTASQTLQAQEVPTKTACIDDDSAKAQLPEDLPTIPLTLNNVACTSIVSEELAECVTVTTTSSQIAGAKPQGAVPKSKPVSQLSAARPKSKLIPKKNSNETESLEEMVKRLQGIPFPAEAPKDEEQKKDEQHDPDETKHN